MISISIDNPELKKAEKALEGIKNGFPRAVSKSINAGLLARTEASKSIRARYNLKATAIKSAMEMKKASTGHLEGSLEAKGPMLPLEAFNPKVRVKKSHQYVYAAIVKGKAKLIKGAFMPHGRAFERRQPARFPIFPISVIGVPIMVSSRHLQPKIEERMRAAYETAFKANVNFYLSKAKLQSMTIYQLEDAVTEFVKANTSDFRFASNDETVELSEPRVWSGFVPRDEVGQIVPGDISTYPAIVVNVNAGEMAIDQETTTINIIVCCFDKNHDQQGYRDCVNVVQRLKDRFREIDIIRERFIWAPPLSWAINRKLGSEGMNAFPYFFADMTVHFLLPVMMTQYDVTAVDGDVTPGRYNSVPIPTPAPNEHWKHEVPPTIEFDDHYYLPTLPPPLGPCVITPNDERKRRAENG